MTGARGSANESCNAPSLPVSVPISGIYRETIHGTCKLHVNSVKHAVWVCAHEYEKCETGITQIVHILGRVREFSISRWVGSRILKYSVPYTALYYVSSQNIMHNLTVSGFTLRAASQVKRGIVT